MLMNKLESIDRAIVLFINGLHTPLLDEIMWFISGKFSLLPLYLLLLFLLKRAYSWKEFGIILAGLLVVILITDQTSVHLFKNLFERYRPSHNEHIKDLLHFYEIKPGEFYTGGKYGFVSSHSANFFGLLSFIYPFFKKEKPIIFSILLVLGILVCVSRMYLGVHYFSDVTVGASLGILIGYLIRNLVKITLRKNNNLI
ncbi:MAG: phosphatase PAP2 family protein [Flavobacteriales bacterium]|nr:phosphatase PAP2 family protein [Flavobacteriales bacterium]